MSVEMDRRLIERRRRVREESARSSLRRLLWILAAAGLAGAALWVVQSPWLQVSQLVVHGAEAGRVVPVLEREKVELGRPLLLVRPGRVTEALLSDPWISEAKVSLVFPDTVEIEVTERTVGAWLAGPGSLVATDGVILAQGGTRGGHDYVIDIDAPGGAVGEEHPDSRVLGALAFLVSLANELEGPVTVTERSGELWADVSDIDVRLGRPVAMEAKAAALVATLSQGVEQGSVIVLLAPTRPAIIPPIDDAAP